MDRKRASRIKRQLDFAATKMHKTYVNEVAKSLQRAVVYEAGAFVGNVKHMSGGSMTTSYTKLGEVVCVTCGTPGLARALDMQGGHFLSGRGASYVFEEVGINVQCTSCNKYASGNHEQYERYMLAIYGREVVDELHRLKNQVVKKWSTIELANKRVDYIDRVNAAIKLMDSYEEKTSGK